MFAKLFGEYLKAENILQNYDEFAGLKALQSLDTSDEQAVEKFKSKYYLDDADIEAMQTIDMPSERAIQDYRSTYNDTRDWLRRDKEGQDKDKSMVDWDDVVFEIDLLKSQEINLDYILVRISVIAIARFRCFSSKLSCFLQFSNVNDYAAHFSGFKYTSSI